MSAADAAAPVVGALLPIELAGGGTTLLERSRAWAVRMLGPATSILVLALVCYQLRALPVGDMRMLLPAGPLFWGAFALCYLLGPLSEYAIFRKLWGVPIGSLRALLLKLISNELLLGYFGEAYFYAWARRKVRIEAAPFGVIKDVAVLSAIVGNLLTLAMVAAVWPFIPLLRLPIGRLALAGSLAFILLPPLVATLARHRLFSLAPAKLGFVAAVHLARAAGVLLLWAALWHLLLPAVALSWWLVLAMLRQLLSRLPLLPNKDVIFAGLVMFLVGPAAEIAHVVAVTAALTLATHLVLGGLLGAAELANGGGR